MKKQGHWWVKLELNEKNVHPEHDKFTGTTRKRLSMAKKSHGMYSYLLAMFETKLHRRRFFSALEEAPFDLFRSFCQCTEVVTGPSRLKRPLRGRRTRREAWDCFDRSNSTAETKGVMSRPQTRELGRGWRSIVQCLGLETYGCGSKSTTRNWTAYFSPRVHLPGFEFGYLFLTHTHMAVGQNPRSLLGVALWSLL